MKLVRKPIPALATARDKAAVGIRRLDLRAMCTVRKVTQREHTHLITPTHHKPDVTIQTLVRCPMQCFRNPHDLLLWLEKSKVAERVPCRMRSLLRAERGRLGQWRWPDGARHWP